MAPICVHQFAHGGDLHLGPQGRNADRRAAFEQYIAAGLALPALAAWLLPGDLNHGRMTIDDRNYLVAQMKRMASRAPVVITRGNHDLPGDLDVLAELQTRFPVFVVNEAKYIVFETATGATATVFCLPFTTEGNLIAAGVAPADVPQAAATALDALLLNAGRILAEARTAGRIPLAIGHLNVAGSVTASGQPNIGKEIELTPAQIQRLGPVYVGLNHIHVGQAIGGAYYPGSFCRLDWGEVHPKRWLLVEYCFTEGESHDEDGLDWQVTAQPIDVAPMYHLEGELTRDGYAGVLMGGGDPPASWAGCDVRAIARYDASLRDLLDLATVDIRHQFAACRRFELQTIAVHDRALRAPAVAAARTLVEKIHAWAAHCGVEASESVISKLVVLEQGDRVGHLAYLDRELAALTATETPAVAA